MHRFDPPSPELMALFQALPDQPPPANISVPIGFLRELSDAGPRAEIMACFAKWCMIVTSGDRCTIGTIIGPDEIRFDYMSGGSLGLSDGKFRLSGSIAGYALTHGQTVVIPDLAIVPTPGCQMLAALGHRMLVMAPITTGSKCFGLITVSFRRTSENILLQSQTLSIMAQTLATKLLVVEQLEQLEILATTDALTGVQNRHHFSITGQRLWEGWSRYQLPFAMTLLDLDNFKRVNDTYGHDAGDVVLQTLAQRLRSQVRGTDHVIRLGGEEFLILMENTALEAAIIQSARLRAMLHRSPVLYGELALTVTASFGVASVRQEDVSYACCLKRADEATYAAKNGGRDRIVAASEKLSTVAA